MADWIWTFDDDPSDLSVPGNNFDKRLMRFAENVGVVPVNVSFNTTEQDFYYSAAGQPSSNQWRAGELWSARVEIILANVRITLSLALARVNSSGVFQQQYANAAGPFPCTAGIKNYSGTTLAQTDPQAGDRIRLVFVWVRNSDFGNSDVSFGFGDPLTDFLKVPIEMANSLITWNGNALNFPNPLTGYRAISRSRRFVGMSDGKVHETSLRTTFDEVRVRLANFVDVDFEADLRAWWAWARAGNQYAFALDSADQVDTTLDGAAADLQKVIPLASTAGIVVGKKYLIRVAIGNDEEVVHVDTISAGISVTARDNLKYSYASGDIFRTRDFFPKVVAAPREADLPVIENPGLTFTLDHTMVEDAA